MIWLCLTAFGSDADVPLVDDGTTDEAQLGLPNRSERPAIADPTALELSDTTAHEIRPGLTGYHVRVPRLRDVRVVVRNWSGMVELEGRDSAQSSMVDSVWTWGSEQYDSDALSELADVLDLSISSSVENHRVSLTLEVPKEDLEKGLDVLADVYLHPTFAKKDLKLVKEQYDRFYTSQGPKSPSTVAQRALSFAWRSADHPYGSRPDPAAIQAVKPKELLALHQRLIAQGPVTIQVIGDLDWSEIEPMLAARFPTLGEAGERGQLLEVTPPNAFRVLAIDMPESEQAVMRLRLPAPHRDSDERVPMDAIGFALGGHFLARLNKNLREDKGWTYGTTAFYSAGDNAGSFHIGVDVPVDKFALTVAEIRKELGAIATGGVTEDEVQAYWRAQLMEFNSTRGTIGDAAGLYGSLAYHEESVADRVSWIEAVGAVDPARTQAVAAEVFAEDVPRVWVVAGPREELDAGFESLGWDPEWVSADDAIIGKMKGGVL